ncbi:unnamed protein product, partial [Choristocarpus tenellus]
PIVATKVARHSRKYCLKGTKVLVPSTVDSKSYKEFMVEDISPTIKVRIPSLEGHTVFMQQDGAKSHFKGGNTEEIKDDIAIETQPANSPDLYVNDLGFFCSIEQLKEDMNVISTEELVEATMEAFDVYPRETLEHVWQSLLAVYEEVLGSKSNNVFKVPHLSKEKSEKTGKVPPNTPVDAAKYRD